MIYSDPAVGRAHGYNYDGPADGAYYYTREGQVGDHRAGNRAILEHVSHGRALRLFEAAGSTRLGGKLTKRIAIRPAGETSRMVTDTYDVADNELFEIKPSASRAHIRQAVAHLLDYRGHVPDLRRATVLVSATPSTGLQDYIAAAGLSLAVFHDNNLVRLPLTAT